MAVVHPVGVEKELDGRLTDGAQVSRHSVVDCTTTVGAARKTSACRQASHRSCVSPDGDGARELTEEP